MDSSALELIESLRSGGSGYRVGNVRAVDSEPALTGARTFHVEQSVRAPNNSRNKWQRILEALVYQGQGPQCVLIQFRRRRGIGRLQAFAVRPNRDFSLHHL